MPASRHAAYDGCPPRVPAVQFVKPFTVRLLIVEDDDRLADAMRRGLQDQGHVVDHAANGPNGLLLASDGAYDAIVLDLNLPGRDGLEVLRELRKAGIGTPLVIVTARDDTEDVVAISTQDHSVRAPVFVLPGQAPDCITLPLGFGRRAGGLSVGVGFDAYWLRSSSSPWLS